MMNPELNLSLSAAFAMLEAVVPNFPKPHLKAKALQVWRAVLEAEGVTGEELSRAVVEWIRREKFMPTPSEILAMVVKTSRPSLILDPVKVGEKDGTIILGSRARCELLGIAFQPLEELRQELPRREISEAARNMLEAVLEA